MSGKNLKNLLFVVIFALCAVSFSFVQPVEAEMTGSVTFTYDGVADCTFNMYYVASYSESSGYILASDFADTAMSRTDLEDGKWYALAMTLETLVVSEDIAAEATDETDADGVVSFGNLEEGLYLVTIERMTVDGKYYTAQPLLIMVPEYYSDGTTDYNASYTITKYEVSEPQSTVEVSVQKVWDDENSSENRPSSIKMYLIRESDGEVVDTQTLSSSNNWRYTWTNLDGSEVWYVAEEELEEYGVSYSSADDGTIVITNQQGTGKTHDMGSNPMEESEDTQIEITESSETETTENTEESTGNPSEEESEDSEEPASDSEDETYQEQDDSESEPENDTESDSTDAGNTGDGTGISGGSSGGTSSGSESDKLPQTGAEWGFAALLFAAALVCFIAAGRRKSDLAHDK